MNNVRDDRDLRPRLVKLHIAADDHVRLRLAAVMLDQGIAEFCQKAVVARSQELTKDIQLPGGAAKSQGAKR
jgi:hypothetical protein